MANAFIFDDDDQSQTDLENPEEAPAEEEGAEEGESGNRNFLIAAVILGGIVLLTLICLAGIAFFYVPRISANATQTQAVLNTNATQAAFVEMQTATAQAATPTLLPSDTPTLAPSPTLVIIFATETPAASPTSDPATATVQALETQLAKVNLTTTAQAALGTSLPTSSATASLSKTGFADEVGLPGLFIVSVVLVAVILLARRLRQVPLAH